MADGRDQEKTERATPKRREDARKQGQVAHSREVSTALVVMAALGVFHFGGLWMVEFLTVLTRGFLQNLHGVPMDAASAHRVVVWGAQKTLVLALPVAAAALAAGLAANLLQVGFRMTGEPLSPKLSKLDPVKGFKRLVSPRSLAELIKSVLKIGLVGVVVLIVLRGEAAGIVSLMGVGAGELVIRFGRACEKIALFAGLVLMLLALSDYLYQRWQYERDLRMSKQELKEEFKQREGDPMIRARIRRIQTEMARHRMMTLVPEADVVITNPTHFAVALKYTPGRMPAPEVVAKGAGFVAQKIRRIATEAGIPVIENKPLAQTLFKSVEIGGIIPSELYRAVAEILAYVYSLRRPRS